MRQRITVLTIALVVNALPSQLAFAASPNNRTAVDPNEKICESQVVVGSRLGKKKVCATRAEWAARKAADRQSVEEAQRFGRVPCDPTFRPSGKGVTC